MRGVNVAGSAGPSSALLLRYVAAQQAHGTKSTITVKAAIWLGDAAGLDW